MACRRLTLQEFDALSDGQKSKGFAGESDCTCCDRGCCYYFASFGLAATTTSQGWTTVTSGSISPDGDDNRSTIFYKVATCDSPETAELIWKAYNSDPQTFEITISTDGKCCGTTCVMPFESC
jgi:hypothetical protein